MKPTKEGDVAATCRYNMVSLERRVKLLRALTGLRRTEPLLSLQTLLPAEALRADLKDPGFHFDFAYATGTYMNTYYLSISPSASSSHSMHEFEAAVIR